MVRLVFRPCCLCLTFQDGLRVFDIQRDRSTATVLVVLLRLVSAGVAKDAFEHVRSTWRAFKTLQKTRKMAWSTCVVQKQMKRQASLHTLVAAETPHQPLGRLRARDSKAG